MRCGTFILGTLLLACGLVVRAGEPTIAFGLQHTVISNANISAELMGPIIVTSTVPPCGDTNDPTACLAAFGASVELGAADAGVFLWPNSTVNDGWSLEGISYGTVNGVTNRLIGSIRGTRTEWATYVIHVDNAFGASTYT